MFRELLTAAERFRQEGNLPPVAYKPKSITWVIELSSGKPCLTGPFKRGDLRTVFAPDRQRSGKPSPTNVKPFLLLDKAQYVLGVAKEGKEAETKLLHGAYLQLLEEAYKQTKEEDIKVILDFLRCRLRQEIAPEKIAQIDPDDLVALRVEPTNFPFERPSMQRFWAGYLAREVTTSNQAFCGACGRQRPVLRILPRELVIMKQKCQAASFNLPAFTSFGKKQTENSPLCFDCGSSVVDTLDYLIRSAKHSAILVRVRDGGQGSALQNQLAVYWLSQPLDLTVDDKPIDFEQAAKAFLEGNLGRWEPDPRLGQLEALLRLPWAPRESALEIAENSFHLAVLSANRGRLVVREWFAVSLAHLRERLRRFLDALRLVDPWGKKRPLSIADILDALGNPDPNLTRGLLRTAYLGHNPPSELIGAALPRLRALWAKGKQDLPQEERERMVRIYALTAALKLTLFYGKEVHGMDQLQPRHKSAAYLCGRLLAVLEEAQQIAHRQKSGARLDTTIVHRFYGSACTAPASVFGYLIKLATTAHLAEAGGKLNQLVGEVCSLLDEAGGFPKTLTQDQQAEFALGFWHQRADFRTSRGKSEQT